MYERMIKTMRGFLRQRWTDRVAMINGKLPPKQQRKMDSIIKQAMRFGDPERDYAYNELLKVHNALCDRLAAHRETVKEQAAEIVRLVVRVTGRDKYIEERDVKIAELEQRLVIDTLNPNRREHICQLETRIRLLEWELATETRQHWELCDSEGLGWNGDIPEEPADLPDEHAMTMLALIAADKKELEMFRFDQAESKRIANWKATRL
jgi:hypothetical protein